MKNSNELLKTTSLLYFRDALDKQSFEECGELLGLARNFGAEQGEISDVIAGYLKGEKLGAGREARGQTNRVRSLK